jgi:hypothetical protein
MSYAWLERFVVKLGRVDRALWSCVVLAVASTIAGTADAQPTFRPPNYKAKIAALNKAGLNLVPLFVLGDVNEDGVVDERDAELVRRLVQSRVTQPSGAVSCPAAADLDRNGDIDQRDLDLILGWVKPGKLPGPALSFQSYLPCNFKQFFIASSNVVMPGGSAQIRFLTPKLTTANSTITVDDGNAEIRRAPDRRGYMVTVRAGAKMGDLINLRIELPDSRVYLYTVAVGRLAR